VIRTIIAATAAAAALAIPATAGAAVPAFLADPRTPTDITAVADPPGGLELTGTLTTAAGPVAGATVTFTTNGASRLLCTAVTDVDGLAACAITGAQRVIIRTAGGIWYARFAGDATLAPVFRAGHL
jgi:hypothetical protein